MAIVAINGSVGSVTFAAGYTTNPFSWEVSNSKSIIDNTPFSPAGSFRTRTPGIGSWTGSYRCHAGRTVTTTMAGPTYITFVPSYELTLTADILDTTSFTDTDTTSISALYSMAGSFDAYLEDTTALPAPEAVAGAVFTVTAGVTYTCDIHTGEAVRVSVAADGSQRIATIPFISTGQVVDAGAPPMPGTTGAATFVATAGRQYSGDIIINSVNLTVSADRTQGEYNIGFVGTGALVEA